MLEKINVNALDIDVGARKDILEDVKSQFYWMIVFHLKNSRNVAGEGWDGQEGTELPQLQRVDLCLSPHSKDLVYWNWTTEIIQLGQ